MHIRPADTVAENVSGKDLQLINIDCTGLEVMIWVASKIVICLADKHSQSIYDPSVTPLKFPRWNTSRDISCFLRL